MPDNVADAMAERAERAEKTMVDTNLLSEIKPYLEYFWSYKQNGYNKIQ